MARGAHGGILLLWKLVGELEARLRRHVGHSRLERVEAALGTKLPRRHHAHVHVLLLCSLELLLLLLQHLDLLLESHLLDSGV